MEPGMVDAVFKTYHPSNAINKHLLDKVSTPRRVAYAQLSALQHPKARLAITHDDVWCSVLTKVDQFLPASCVCQIKPYCFTGRHNCP
jgi:hypothetical protein